MRYTKRDALGAFERLADATGATIADSSWHIHDPRRYGAWTLDYNGAYGGFVVHAYAKDSRHDGPQAYTAVSVPLGHERRTAREFCDAVSFALQVLRVRDDAR